ncbi:MAG: TetR/AcrR family transcriptional regulator [Gammaproteobacteria bacterium]|nr:TetR/AcrR family transcriptional regulator [Gammaproteobacteria bacterium]
MRMTPRYVDNVNIMVSPKSERAYHHGDLRNALIEAGLSALASQDASELSLRALARYLGVSANAVYRHFADKEALLSALAAEGFRRFARAQAEARAKSEQDPLATGMGYVHFAQQHPALFRLMFGSFTRSHEDAELQEAAIDAFGQLLQDSRAPGQTGDIDEATMMLAIARWSLVHGLSHLLLEGQLGLFGAQGNQHDALIAAVLQASVGGMKATAAPPACDQPLGKPSTKASN